MSDATATRLSGRQKAAVLLLSAGEPQAAKIFARLDIEEIKELTHGLATLGTIPGVEVEAALREFASSLARGGALVGTVEAAERLLGSFLDQERVSAIMDEIRGPTGRSVWDKLGGVSEAVLASFLSNEYPQTIAVVLSRIHADHAGRVLAQLPDDVAIDAILRMLRMEVVQKEVLSDVETTLRSEFMTTLGRNTSRDPHENMAEIFNALDRSSESRLLQMLEERNKEAADRVRTLMFTFEDLAKIDGPGIQSLLRKVDNARLTLALKGASDPIRDLFLGNMSERAGMILRDDMEALGPVKVRDVEDAQAALVSLAKELEAAGELVIAGNEPMIG